MFTIIIGLLLVIIALFTVALQRFYSCLPVHELKRLAARGDQLAVKLYRAVGYGVSLRVLLWLVAGICLPTGFLLLVRYSPIWLSLPTMVVALSAGTLWLPNMPLTWRNARLAGWLAPALDWVLHYVHGWLGSLGEQINSHRTLAAHSGLYEKDDLARLLTQQQAQEDSRIDPTEIELMKRALQFSQVKVVDIALPRKEVCLFSTSEPLGPVLFDELHKSNQQFFAVYRGKKDNIVGVLAASTATEARKGGTVADIMTQNLCFIGEEFNLSQLAEAFTTTGQQVAIVINRFEEFVGVITLADLTKFLFADQPERKAEVSYEDRAAVAQYRAESMDENPEVPSPELPEVVE